MNTEAPKLWLKVIVPELGAIGPGKIRLLQMIDETGSISASARALGMSYSRAWKLIDDLNQIIAQPVVETRIGGDKRGGAALTQTGRDVVSAYLDVEQQAMSGARRSLRRIAKITSRERNKRDPANHPYDYHSKSHQIE